MKGQELLIVRFLKWGVIISGFLMFVGLSKLIKFSGNPFFNFQTYDQIPLSELITYYTKIQDWGTLCSYVGLGLLILLPFIRVFITIFIFLKNREYVLSGIAFIVLIGLIFGLYLGFKINKI
jgi:uncharacterized membrane protein